MLHLQMACRLLQVRVLPEARWAGSRLDRAIAPWHPLLLQCLPGCRAQPLHCMQEAPHWHGKIPCTLQNCDTLSCNTRSAQVLWHSQLLWSLPSHRADVLHS